MRRYNTIQALRHLVDGGNDPRFPGGNWITQVPEKKCLNKLLSGWYAVKTPSLEEENNTDIEGLKICYAFEMHESVLTVYKFAF